MNKSIPPSLASSKKGDFQFAFDVGYSSIGWAVLTKEAATAPPVVLGCGVVTFTKDGCLASERRVFRRQRRHVRATRVRIARMEQLLAHLGVLSEAKLAAKHTSGGGHAAPWLLAARTLKGGPLLKWDELWDVLRWYAHNRGYDGNRAWSGIPEANAEDTEKETNALALFDKYKTRSMAQVFCDISGLDPLGSKISTHLEPQERPKGLNAAFPRADVEAEVRQVLERHKGHLPKLNDAFIRCLMEDWKALPCPALALPTRYGQIISSGQRSAGGLLFGQLIPRFENRIIATCPILYERIFQEINKTTKDEAKARATAEKRAKVPSKDTPEYFRFRWAMQVANIKVADGTGARPLSIEERNALDAEMQSTGVMTKGDFKKAIAKVVGKARTNVEEILTHPDADKALVLDPARDVIRKQWKELFSSLPPEAQKRGLGRLRRGHPVSLGELLQRFPSKEATAAIEKHLAAGNTRKRRGQGPLTKESLLAQTIQASYPSGRAPFSREIMKEVTQEVFSTTRHPMEEGGTLFRTEAIRTAHRLRSLDHQTNNHLVRHRLLILDRLHRQLLESYAGKDLKRVSKIVIEVNRDLGELSGKTAKEIASELGKRLHNFKSVSTNLEKALAGTGIPITPGLIRKARIAEDLGWQCPYTGKPFEAIDLAKGKVDKDHIIPYADRQSDSLDSLVITFSSVNRMKGKRSAMQFIRECGGQNLSGEENCQIRPLAQYLKAVEALDTRKGHPDDQNRKRRRKEFLLLEEYVEKAFTSRDLTQTSHLVRLGALLLERPYEKHRPPIISLPGSVTGVLRKSWRLTGCLSLANPHVIDTEGKIRPKTELRGITQLHHALDACVLGLSAHYIPSGDGSLWALMLQRGKLKPADRARLNATPLGALLSFDSEGRIANWALPPSVKENIRQRLAERRIVQHLPAELNGLKVEQNAWRILKIEDGRAHLTQRIRQPDGSRPKKERTEQITKLLGATHPGKLQRNKSVLIIPDNYGLALDPEPRIIPYFKVPVQLRRLREENGGKPVRILRNGMQIHIPSGRYQGDWKIFSIKNNATGLALDIAAIDAVSYKSGDAWGKHDVNLKTLIKAGMAIIKTNLTGPTPAQ